MAGTIARAATSSAGFTVGEFSNYMAVTLPLLYLVLIILDILGRGRPLLGVLLYLLLLGLVLLTVLGIYLDADKEFGEANRDEIEVVASVLLVMSIAAIVSFSQLCRHWNEAFGGFLAERGGYWHWLRFGAANFAESVLLDVPAIYEWKITDIKPTEFWPRGLLFVYRTSLELLVVAGLVGGARAAWRHWGSQPGGRHSGYFSFIFPGVGRLIVLALWLAPSAVFVTAMVKGELLWETTWGSLQYGAFVTLGAWLSWQSLWALSIRGRVNKLWAVAGVLAGAAVVYLMWPQLVAHLGR